MAGGSVALLPQEEEEVEKDGKTSDNEPESVSKLLNETTNP